MPAKLLWKWIVIVGVLLACIAGVTGLPTSKEALLENWKKNIRLGLDLRGGSQIVMQIQVQDAFKVEADGSIERLKSALRDAQVAYAAIERNELSVETAGDIRITVKGVSSGQTATFRRITTEILGNDWTFATEGPSELQLRLRPEAARRLREETVTQSIATFDRRINGLGVADTSIQRRGGGESAEVLIQLPGLDDPLRVKSMLQTAALLELSSVVAGPFSSTAAAYDAHNGILPPNSKLARGLGSAAEPEVWWLLARSPVVTGRDLRDARPQPGDLPGRWDTDFLLTPAAAERFGQFTEANINQRLAIVLDNVVLSAPLIENRIQDRGRIIGASSRQEATDLALNLRAGALPAGVKVAEESTVGPSLGADSISRGMRAGAVGLLLVISSIILYYRGTGLNAVLALLLNTVITIAGLSYFGATWTLPGIAGLVLSIGMAWTPMF